MESHGAGCMISYLTGHIIKYIMESHRVLLHSTPHIMDHVGIWCMISCLISHIIRYIIQSDMVSILIQPSYNRFYNKLCNGGRVHDKLCTRDRCMISYLIGHLMGYVYNGIS